jgi:transaldolase
VQGRARTESVVTNPTEKLHDLGQSLWVDNIDRGMLDEGRLRGWIEELSVTGLTSNPTIFDKAIGGSDAYDDSIRALHDQGLAGEDLFFELALEDLRRAADLFVAVHERTDGVDGWVSLEVSPLIADDTEATIEQVERLHIQSRRNNIFIKIPGTMAGKAAIEESIHAAIPVNVTLLFSTDHYLAAADAYMSGIERRIEDGEDPDVPSVASLFISRWDKAVSDVVPDDLRDELGIAVAKRTYRAYRELHDSDRWQRLENEGARPQRLLWASTGTKDPDASDVLYVEALAAPLTINTMPDKTLLAFADHGQVGEPLPPDGGDCDEVLSAFNDAGIDTDELAIRLQKEGAEAFTQSWSELLATIESETERLAA